MDVFELHLSLIRDYVNYTKSFIRISDRKIAQFVDEAIEGGKLWPEPLLQLNPLFEAGASVDDLVRDNILHRECGQIFRIKSASDPVGRSLILHKHQEEAIRIAAAHRNYVLTTGTGSGKSLAYIVPSVNCVLNEGPGRGIRAIIVYPMNALANSQEEELHKFLGLGYPHGSPVRVERYTGQEDREKRESIRQDPPDILLTNYMMLELMLTRREERPLIKAARGLRFLVLDELHTYRGRQGADVAMLVRRCREAFSSRDMLCVGTSATMATDGPPRGIPARVADVASRVFGASVSSDDVISESLRRATDIADFDDDSVLDQLRTEILDGSVPDSLEVFRHSRLASWIESTFGLRHDADTGGLVRQRPTAIKGRDGAASRLASTTGVEQDRCELAIRSYLLAGSHVTLPDRPVPLFAFRLHQFISRGDTVWSTADATTERHLELRKQVSVPGDPSRRLFPLAFCRECGHEYYRVDRVRDEAGVERLLPRDEYSPTEGAETGYFYASQDAPWPSIPEEVLARVPDDWKEVRQDGTQRLKPRAPVPEHVAVGPDGVLREPGAEGCLDGVFFPTPFRMCLNPSCAIAYNARQRSDRLKLNTLGVDTRSTATTVLALRSIIELKKTDLDKQAQKLLSFTDNRQDASLQAGHFNDFTQVGLIRAALYAALLKSGPDGLSHDNLAHPTFASLDLPLDQYASDPEVRGPARKQTEAALREVLLYFLYRDLQRGWRLTSPNLEQCDLIRFTYDGLDGEDGLLAADDLWMSEETPAALREATREQRLHVVRVLLDQLRRSLAIKVDALDRDWQERMVQQSRQRLLAGTPWFLEDPKELVRSVVAWPRSQRPKDWSTDLFLSPQSAFGSFVRRPGVLPSQHLSLDETSIIIRRLLEMLRVFGVAEAVRSPKQADDVHGYQLASAAMVWRPGDGTLPPVDHLRVVQSGLTPAEANPYFVDFYKEFGSIGTTIEAREHTAQVQAAEREEREKRFRVADLPVLFCSPTMELGVDIAQLNIVNLRNVPPTPANYAQRSGRAGRSGQPALVYTYCSGLSPHDQYYFQQPDLMVSGDVTAPRVDLSNEALVRSHIHAVWLAASGLSLGHTLCDVLQVAETDLSLPLRPEVAAALTDTTSKQRALEQGRQLLDRISDALAKSIWHRHGWLEDVLARIPQSFNQACNRWRGLYRSAVYQRNHQHTIIGDHSRPADDRDKAKRLRAEAEAQIKILTTASGVYEGDFYSYRYFASEGFLPGYNFPRLPLSAFIPGRRGRHGRDEYVSRPRFLAVSEFGPRAIIYHEGVRYRVHKVSLDRDVSEGELATSTMKRCTSCGCGHYFEGDNTTSNCEQCGDELTPDGYWHDLVRMQNVSAKRADNITCDEEERQRMGYRIETAFRFAEDADRHVLRRDAEIWRAESRLATLSYGDSATIWRVNLGWRRSDPSEMPGFILDLDRGYWASRTTDESDEQDPMSQRRQRVVPFVEDYKNALLFWPATPLSAGECASLQAALKEAIQKVYQLEPSELAVLPVPDRDSRRAILLYEASEGGAGVLRHLVDDPTALPRVATEALRIAHFDPESLADTGSDKCGAACYDCLLDYGNQPDHELLSRFSIREYLSQLATSEVKAASAGVSRVDHLSRLMAQCDSGLERKWLSTLEAHGLRLPSHAQLLIESCSTRPDFFYESQRVAIYIDGPPHDEDGAADHDDAIAASLGRAGYLVLRFHHAEDWEQKLGDYPDVFGRKQS